MNVPLPAAAVYVLLLIYLAQQASHHLITLWVVVPIVFPTLRVHIGAPIYLYDMTTVAVLSMLIQQRLLSAYPVDLPRWQSWFTVAGVIATVFPVLRYGAVAEGLYLLGQRLLAWSAFSIAIVTCRSNPNSPAYVAVKRGMLLNAVGLFLLGVVQWGNPAGNSAIQSFYYRDGRLSEVYSGASTARSQSLKRRMDRGTDRVRAPFGSTALAGVAAVTGIMNCLMFRNDPKQSKRYLGLILSTLVVLMSGSRHGVIALAGGMLCAAAVGSEKAAGRILIILVTFLSLLATPHGRELWMTRMAETESGVLADESIRARLVYGPMRMINLYTERPDLLFTGTGIDVKKMGSYGAEVSRLESFSDASNGFLLYLYAMGITGFCLHVYFWGWTLRKSIQINEPSTREICIASVVVTIGIIMADNYAYYQEPVVQLTFLSAGIVVATAKRTCERIESQEFGAHADRGVRFA